jgi:hypothetical protein
MLVEQLSQCMIAFAHQPAQRNEPTDHVEFVAGAQEGEGAGEIGFLSAGGNQL